jgi:hypothetical protein
MKLKDLYPLWGLFCIVIGSVFMVTGDKPLAYYLGTLGMLYLMWADIRELLDR